ncbi:MAG: stage V sporulation protein AD [Oscillospiraceae bacterium]|nr:stage V sporulation protein AD [Oscillospiraceae bacterium]
MATKIGMNTLRMERRPSAFSFAAVGSKKEAEGPLAKEFDILNEDPTFGQSTWEQAESRMQRECVDRALQKGELAPQELDFIFAGDLLNQCISSAYGMRGMAVPYFGLYGACSTMAESLILASLFVETGIARRCLAATSSHFCSAERQFRFPLEYGGQRPPTAQWTVTGAGAVVVSSQAAQPPYVAQVCPGCIEDYGIKDINNMGAAMAPAAARTLLRFFEDTGTAPQDYDAIFTGDLGQVGSDLMLGLLQKEGVDAAARHRDCGLLVYDREKQDVHAGGSGCGCGASVLCSHILPRVKDGRLGEVLFMATGALMSPTSNLQGETIPAIAHLVHFSHSAGTKEER